MFKLNDIVKINPASRHASQFIGNGKIIGIDDADEYKYEVETLSGYTNNYRLEDLILITADEIITPAEKIMNGLEYIKIAKVGDVVRVKTTETTVSELEGGVIEGHVGEIEGKMFYLWQNKISGSQGEKRPTSKGYNYSWGVVFNASTKIEVITPADTPATEPARLTPAIKRKVFITIEKQVGKVIVSLKVPDEIEDFFRKASKGVNKTSTNWKTADDEDVKFYNQPSELERQLTALDDYCFSDYGSGLINGSRINVAILRTVGASKKIDITCETFASISNAELENYVRRLGLYIKKLWETAIATTKIKSVITYEI